MKFKKTFLVMCIIIFLFSIANVCAGDMNDAVMSSEDSTQNDSFPKNNGILIDNLITNEEMMEAGNDEAFLALQNDLNEDYALALEDDGYVHIYVNASASLPGNGTREAPYQNLSSVNHEFRDNTVLHIANGYYVYNNSDSNCIHAFADLKVMGESVENTTIDFCGQGIFAFIEWTPYLYFENIRLFNTSANLISYNGKRTYGGKMEAVNVTFENSKSIAYNGEYYIGGAISCSGELELTNCIFKNNSADRGGAIFALRGGEINNCTFIGNIASEEGGAIFISNQAMEISDSLFINNSALDGGGAVYTKANLSINHSNFEGNHALHGGAIASVQSQHFYLNDVNFVNDSAESSAGAVYSKSSKNYFYNSSFINCSSLIGGAICDLDSFSAFSTLNFTSNRATKGGAVYKMYNTISINDSSFISNQAHDGGGLYADEVDSAVLNDIILDNNTAAYGENIYWLGNISGINITGVDSPDIFNVSFVSLIREAGDYDIYEINDTSVVFDSRYDMRDYGYLTEVKDQEIEGNCWAFAAMAALESCIMKANGTVYDLSEENLKNLMAKFSDYGNFAFETDDGGNMFMSIGYLASWLGPVYEEMDKYSSNSVSLLYDAIAHVQNVIFIPRTSLTENDNIKEAIMKYGAVVATMHYSSAYLGKDKVSYYVNTQGLGSNHAVTIVGWDDNYSKENFKTTPPGDGAFIVRNSWGPDWGENGYFYVSYYDLCFAVVNNIYYPLFTFVLNDTNRYDKNYQHEILISNFGTIDANPTYIGNSFIAEDDELISAVSTYFSDDSDYEIKIFVNDELKHSQSGNSAPGYFTIPLTKYVPVKEGDIMDIMFVITSLNQPKPLLYFFEYSRNPRIAQTGVSFYSGDGIYWYDAQARYNIVIAIKGFTKYGKLNTTLEVDGLDSNWTVNKDFNLVAKVKDQFGDYVNEGNVTFLIGDVEYAVDLNNYTANKTVSFTQAGEYNITVLYDYMHYYYPSNVVSKLIKIDPVNTVLSLSLGNDTLLVGDSVHVMAVVNASQGKVDFYINGVLSNTVEINDEGVAVLVLDNVSYGSYNVTAIFSDERGTYLDSSNKTAFDVHKRNSNLSINSQKTVYGQNAIIALSYNSNATGNVNITVTGNKYNKNYDNLDLDRVIVLSNDIPSDEYRIYVAYSGDGMFSNATANSTLTILKANSTLEVDGIEFDYNTTGYATVSYANASGVIAQVIGHEEAIVDVKDEIIRVSGLDAGNYTLSVTTITDANHNPITKDAKISVSRIDPSISVPPIAYTYGQVGSTKVSVTGGIEFSANVVNQPQAIVGIDGNIITVSGLDAGSYLLNVTTIQNRNYNSISKNIDVAVGRADSNISVGDMIFYYGSYGESSVELEGASNFTADVICHPEAAILTDGNRIILSGLDVGNYTLAATTIPDKNHNSVIGTAKVIVERIPTMISSSDMNIIYNRWEYLVATLKDNQGNSIDGAKVSVDINGIASYITSDSNGEIHISTEGLVPGNYTATVAFGGSNIYLDSHAVSNIVVNRMGTVISTEDVDIAAGEAGRLAANLTNDDGKTLGGANVLVDINGVCYSLKTNSKGQISLSFTDLAIGTYAAAISYAGNSKYNPSSATATISIKTVLIISAVYNAADDEIVSTLTNEATGKFVSGAKVQVNLNGLNYTFKSNSKGQITVSTADLPLGTYTATISYPGNAIYAPASKSIDFTVKTDMLISAVYDAFNNEIVATLTNGITGKPVTGTNVQINLNGAAATVKTNSKGQAKLSAADLPLGSYAATISYAGNSKYNLASTSISFDVKTKVIVTDVYGYTDKLVATLTNGATGKPIVNAYMQVEINGVTKTAKSDSKSQISIDTSDLGLTKYDVTISYGGNSRYTPSSATVAIDLDKANMMITYSYNAEKQLLVATLKNSKTKKVVSNANMVVDINGVKTTLKSNSKGQVTFSTAKLPAGTHVGTISYGGNDRYNSISAAFKVDV